MNRLLIVTLLKKNIEELNMLTEGFREMTEYPAVILNLARKKTDEIKEYIDQLEEKHPETDEIQLPPPPVVLAEEVKNPVEEVIAVTTENVPVIEDEPLPEPNEIPEVEDTQEPEMEEVDEKVLVIESEIESIEESVLETEITPGIASTIEEVVEEVRKATTLGDKIQNGPSRNEVHARPENSGINATIANKKVDDIRQAISLGDRFRFQRELFRNNGEDMNKTLSYINMLATYNEVISFLVSKYGWQEDNEAVQDFFQIIKRKF